MGGKILEFHSNLKRPRAHDNYLVLSENSMLNDPATSHVLKDPLWFRLQPSEDKVHAHQSNSVTQHGDASSLSFLPLFPGTTSWGMSMLQPSNQTQHGRVKERMKSQNTLQPTSYKPHPSPRPRAHWE